jgi:hypothetical protein
MVPSARDNCTEHRGLANPEFGSFVTEREPVLWTGFRAKDEIDGESAVRAKVEFQNALAGRARPFAFMPSRHS